MGRAVLSMHFPEESANWAEPLGKANCAFNLHSKPRAMGKDTRALGESDGGILRSQSPRIPWVVKHSEGFPAPEGFPAQRDFLPKGISSHCSKNNAIPFT